MNTNLNTVGNTIENAVHDTMDKAIVFTGKNAVHAARATVTAIADVMNYNADIRDANGTYFIAPDSRFDQKPLTIPERAIVAAFALHFEKYTVGLERTAVIHFPKIISSPDCDKDDIADVGFESEARAYMFAEVVEHVFNLEASVIEAPNGCRWLVAVSSPHGINGEQYEQLRGVCSLVLQYNIEYAADSADTAADDGNNAPLTRLESMVGQILSRLEQNPATVAKTPPAARDAFDPSQDDAAALPKVDKHRLPDSSRKSSSKRTA